MYTHRKLFIINKLSSIQKDLGCRTKRVVDMFCTSQELVAESECCLELDEDTEFDIE